MPAPATETGPADRTQVLVIGGGFAGLCAAIQAARDGAQTTLLDAAPAHLRGGNARHCRNIRLAHLDETPWQRDTYPVAEFTADMARMGTPDAALAAVLAEGARDLGPWLAELGVAFEPWADGNLPYSRRTAFFRGGGQALVNALTRAAQRAGVEIRHEWHVTALPCPTQTGPLRVAADTPDGHRTIQAAALVLACGGYGGDRDRLSETLGPRGAGIANRGTPHQRGAPLHWLLENGAAAAGQPGDGHLVAVDARAPLDDAGIVSRVDGMQLGIVVDATGHRFMDEGETATPARYSTWGRALAARPDPRAWLVLGADTLRHLPPMLYPPIRADGAAALALQSGIDAAGLAATLAQVNAHLSGGPPPDPPRSRWDKAPLAPLTGPLAAIPMQPGLAFTRHGLAVDAGARVQLTNGAPAPRLFAAGTAMCGAVLGQGYLSGTALTIAGVFGRIAGENAARQAREAPAAPIKCRTAAAPRPVAPPPPPSADPLAEARRALNICNTCGFCTGLCDVFPAAQARPDLTAGDLRHLAHLCHDCRSCYYDCQYAPPHDFAVNVPAAMAEMRTREYRSTLIPRGREAAIMAAVFTLCLLGVPLAALLAVPAPVLFAVQSGPGAFYAVIPHGVMSGGAALAFGGAGALLALRVVRFWRAGSGPAMRLSPGAMARALGDVLRLRNLGGGTPGCEDRAGPTGTARRWAHHLLAYGFGLTFLATMAGAVLHRAGHLAPYPLASAPVLLGGVGGIAMLAGLAGLEWRRRHADRAPATPGMERADRVLRAQLAVVAASGLVLLAARDTAAMGVLLALHLGSVLGLALCLPFGKLSHGAYRAAALLRHAGERAAWRAPGLTSAADRGHHPDR